MRHAVRLGFVVATLFANVSRARADEPPPKGYVEPCTLEIQCAAGRVCSATVGKIDPRCAKEASAAGMRERCRTQGATHSSAIFCPSDAPSPSEAEVRAKTGKGCGGCRARATSSDEATWGVGFAYALALTAARRRASRASRCAPRLERGRNEGASSNPAPDPPAP